MIKKISEALGVFLSRLLPLNTPFLLQAVATHFYTGFVRTRFASWGKASLIGYPASGLSGTSCIYMGEHTEVATGVFLLAWPERITPSPVLRIGNNCHIGKDNLISAAVRIELGDNLLTGPNVMIVDNSHGETTRETLEMAPADRPLASKGEVIIGKNVWLGRNVCVLSGVHIGDGVIVAAGSVVTHDIPPYCVAAGIPARVVRQAGK